MPVTIRSAVLDDVSVLLVIEREAATAAHWTAEQYERRVAEGLILVAEEERRISGFVCAKVVAKEWEIENMVVAVAARRRGIGGRLLDELLRRARNEDGTAVWLEVRESNQGARSLYEKHGFCEAGRRRLYYGDPVEDAVLYQLRLERSEGHAIDLKP